MRSWLNGYGSSENQCGVDYTNDNFLDNAFSNEEQEAIVERTVVNSDNPYYQTEGGNDTQDKLFLLSIDEVTNPAYGFSSDHEERSKTRRATRTDYTGSDDTSWWLRSPSMDSEMAEYIHFQGAIGRGQFAGGGESIRPALRLNLKSGLWSYAGTVSSEGDIDEKKPDESSTAVKNPIPLEGAETSTWDCVYFGCYPQSSDGKGGFKEEPIKWRVLFIEGKEALLLADKKLDAMKYNEESVEVNWGTCTARSWLNGYGSSENRCGVDYTNDNFLDNAFSSEEQEAIFEKDIQYKNNGTQDKIFFLSNGEARNQNYGFSSDDVVNTKTRRAVPTAYAASKTKSNFWWLRSLNREESSECVVVGYNGTIRYGSAEDCYMTMYGSAVRPALWLNLNSDVWSYAGTVSSDDPLETPNDPIIALDRITAAKTKTAYKTNETLNINDLTVTAFYSDGSSKAVKNYKTNAAAIDMATAGNKNLTVTYEENNVTKTAAVQITVTKQNEPPAPGKPITATQENKKPTKPAAKPKKPKTVTLKKVTSPKKGKLKLTWKKDKSATGYQAMIATDKKFKKNKKTATIKKNKTVAKTFTKLKNKKTYFAKVRAYKQVGKTKVYGAYSKVKRVKVK